MKDKKNIIVYDGCFSHHMLIAYHRGEVIIDNKLQEADVVDDILKEWWVDNTTHYSFKSMNDAKTFRGYIAHAKRGYCFKEQSAKDKRIVVYSKECDWWELVIKNQELYVTRIKNDTEDFNDIFNTVYAPKYKKYQQFEFSEEDSPTKKMKAITKYLNAGK